MLLLVVAPPLASAEIALPQARVLASPSSGFDPQRDIFDFPNELVWDYGIEGARKQEVVVDPDAIDIRQHCSQMARAVRQFHYSARFAPHEPRVSDEELRERVERVMDSDPRLERVADDPIVIPGYPDLRAFSRDRKELLMEAVTGLVRAYIQRGNWRMVFPFSPEHQRDTAEALLADLERGHPPIVHLVRFPRVTMNHTLLVYRAEATAREIRFISYDPNLPGEDLALSYDRAEARFELGVTPYWPGGPVTAYEIFHGWIY